MATKQLITLLKFEQDKEQKAAQALQAAEQDYQQNIARLNSVSAYRLEYLKRVNERSVEGIDSIAFGHFHGFIQKLDNAAEQVEIALKQAKALMKQKKESWLLQRQKVQAVELLLAKKEQEINLRANRLEQKMFDEIATQQFVRRKLK